MEIKKVGVIGLGTMGSGIAQISAQAGYQVVASEINETLLGKGLANISTSLGIELRRRRLSQADLDATLARIKGTTSFNDFAECDLVIEAAPESLPLKKQVFSELDRICPSHCLLATNTSCLSVIDIARVTTCPEKVLGLHFFNPVNVMRLLEVVRTLVANDETIEAGKAFGKSLGKTTIVAPDTPGFVVNRLLMPFMLGAFRLLETGVSKEAIDEGARLGLGHPMGPLKLADLVGLDTVLYIANAIYDELKDPLYAPPLILKKMVVAGWLGRKTGKGFYDYRGERESKEET